MKQIMENKQERKGRIEATTADMSGSNHAVVRFEKGGMAQKLVGP